MDAQIIRFPVVQDSRGELVFAEAERHLPFAINRFYLIHSVPTHSERGGHTHIEAHQVITAICGGFTLLLEDVQGTRKRFEVCDPREGVYIPPMHWRVLQDFKEGTVCLVVSSTLYHEADYIRDYESFKRVCRSVDIHTAMG